MVIQDNTLKQKLENIYFIWGSGKTTLANALAEKYGFYVYHTDDAVVGISRILLPNISLLCAEMFLIFGHWKRILP